MKIYYDFHLHSCLSLCAEDEMTPANIANMASLAGLTAAAVSDHQSVKNCPAFLKAAERIGLLAIPAMELCTIEEVHVLCLFSTLAGAERFGRYVEKRLIPLPERVKKTWRHSVMDENDAILEDYGIYLGGASDIGIYEVNKLIYDHGGVAIPAHVDRPSNSLISNLGFYDPALGFTVCELTNGCDAADFVAKNPSLRQMKFIRNSDAHSLKDIPDASNFIEAEEMTPAAVIEAIKCI